MTAFDPMAPLPVGPPTQLIAIPCPRCGLQVNALQGPTTCAACGWRGDAYVFNPLPIQVEHAEQALPEDATCLHHPSKKATAICAGTGDYICALCAVELDGQIFSANYLSTAGKKKAGKAFEKYLRRPDSLILIMMILTIIPGPCYLMVPASVLWVPYAFYLYINMLRLRAADPLYARVVGMGRMILIPVLLALFCLSIAGIVVGLIINALGR